jgi:regulator of sigma E protease
MNILVFLVILSLMMVLHELGHFMTAKFFKITVQEFGIGLPPRVWGIKRGGVMYSLNAIPFGAFVKMLGEEDPSAPGSFASKSRRVRTIVLAAGSGMNFLLAVVAFSLAMMVGTPSFDPNGPVKIASVSPSSPAEAVGLRGGDTITSVNGTAVSVQQFRDQTASLLDKETTLGVRRDNADSTVTLTPRSSPPAGQGAFGVVLSSNALMQMAPHVALWEGTVATLRVIGGTLAMPMMLIQGAIAPEDARLVGLVGMAQITSGAVDYVADQGTIFPLLVLTGIFSAGLSIANLLPIPALDGGRLLFVLIEAIRGRRVSPEREAAVHFVGIVVLLALMVLISVNDVIAPAPAINWGPR